MNGNNPSAFLGQNSFHYSFVAIFNIFVGIIFIKVEMRIRQLQTAANLVFVAIFCFYGKPRHASKGMKVTVKGGRSVVEVKVERAYAKHILGMPEHSVKMLLTAETIKTIKVTMVIHKEIYLLALKYLLNCLNISNNYSFLKTENYL